MHTGRYSLSLALLLCCGREAVAFQAPAPDPAPQTVTFEWALAGNAAPADAETELRDGRLIFARTFILPAGCQTLRETTAVFGPPLEESNAASWTVEGAAYTCERASLLQRGRPTARRDYISRVKFGSLRLEDLPYSVHCFEPLTQDWIDLCERVHLQDAAACMTGTLPTSVSAARFAAKFDAALGKLQLDCQVQRVDDKSCRLRDGEFRGSVDVEAHVVRCAWDEEASGFSLGRIAFRDLDSDGIMDVLLVFQGVGGGSAPGGFLHLALTKRSVNSSLELLKPQ